MKDDGIITDNTERVIPDAVYENVTDEERKEFATLKTIEIDTQ